MKRQHFFFFFFLLVAALTASANTGNLLRGGPSVEGVRPAGMGGAFLALADDANALFYNPAGLASNKEVRIHLFDLYTGFDSQNTLDRMRRAIFDSDYDNLLRRDMQYMRFGFAPKFLFPYTGFSIYNNMQGYFDMRDLANRGMNAFGVNDLGATFGIGLPLNPYFSLGISAKAIYRSGIDVALTPGDLIDFIALDEQTFAKNMGDYVRNQTSLGWGVGFDVGAKVTVPTAGKNSQTLNLAAVINDLGHTTFRSIGTNPTPTPNLQSFNFGAALQFPMNVGKSRGTRRGVTPTSAVLNLAADYLHAFESIGWYKQVCLGLEYRHPVFGLRIGARHGYPTFGASIEFPPHTRLHFATYSVELGDRLWTNQQRWYQIQLVIGFNPL